MTTNCLSTVRKWVSVEPTLFFIQFSTAIINALMGSELFRKVGELYKDEVPAGSSAQEEDDIYKSHLITWNIIIRASATLPVFVIGIWGGKIQYTVVLWLIWKYFATKGLLQRVRTLDRLYET
jgi:hypothetical protein